MSLQEESIHTVHRGRIVFLRNTTLLYFRDWNLHGEDWELCFEAFLVFFIVWEHPAVRHQYNIKLGLQRNVTGCTCKWFSLQLFHRYPTKSNNTTPCFSLYTRMSTPTTYVQRTPQAQLWTASLTSQTSSPLSLTRMNQLLLIFVNGSSPKQPISRISQSRQDIAVGI